MESFRNYYYILQILIRIMELIPEEIIRTYIVVGSLAHSKYEDADYQDCIAWHTSVSIYIPLCDASKILHDFGKLSLQSNSM